MLEWVKNFALFWYILVSGFYITWPKQFKTWKGLVVVGILTHTALFHFKVAQMCCWQVFPWLSLAICSYHPSLPAGLLDYILCPYRVVADKFLLVCQHLHVCVKGSIEEHCLWVCPYFSSSVPHVSFILFGLF